MQDKNNEKNGNEEKEKLRKDLNNPEKNPNKTNPINPKEDFPPGTNQEEKDNNRNNVND